MSDVVDVTVLIPTLGREDELRACLASFALCRPAPAEILVVDDGDDDGTRRAITASGAAGVRRVAGRGRGLAAAFNLGLREASHDTVLVTNDDCTVRDDWAGAAARLLRADPTAILTGPVLPSGNPLAVPSFIEDDERRTYAGAVACDKLYTNNMVVSRSAALAFGGFDERFRDVAEDNDLCYRWLGAGRRIVYEPGLVVWHHDWRTPEQMRRQYERYARWQAAFYAKHLRAGDRRVLRFLARDVRSAVGGAIGAGGRPPGPWPDPRRSLPRGLAQGLVRGWSEFADDGFAPHLPPASRRIREDRRRPRPYRWDYLHLRTLRADLQDAVRALPTAPSAVLDVFCGTRPYEDLLPRGAAVTGLDIDDRHGVADVVSTDFLPFADQTFDLVLCIEAFHYVADPAHGVAEIQRVLRPGGTAIVSVPLVWEYDPSILEHRFTGPELAALFARWDDVRVIADGERAVAWATLTGRLLNLVEERAARGRVRAPVRLPFALLYLLLNGAGAAAERAERRLASGATTLPMNLLLTARRP